MSTRFIGFRRSEAQSVMANRAKARGSVDHAKRVTGFAGTDRLARTGLIRDPALVRFRLLCFPGAGFRGRRFLPAGTGRCGRYTCARASSGGDDFQARFFGRGGILFLDGRIDRGSGLRSIEISDRGLLKDDLRRFRRWSQTVDDAGSRIFPPWRQPGTAVGRIRIDRLLGITERRDDRRGRSTLPRFQNDRRFAGLPAWRGVWLLDHRALLLLDDRPLLLLDDRPLFLLDDRPGRFDRSVALNDSLRTGRAGEESGAHRSSPAAVAADHVRRANDSDDDRRRSKRFRTPSAFERGASHGVMPWLMSQCRESSRCRRTHPETHECFELFAVFSLANLADPDGHAGKIDPENSLANHPLVKVASSEPSCEKRSKKIQDRVLSRIALKYQAESRGCSETQVLLSRCRILSTCPKVTSAFRSIASDRFGGRASPLSPLVRHETCRIGPEDASVAFSERWTGSLTKNERKGDSIVEYRSHGDLNPNHSENQSSNLG